MDTNTKLALSGATIIVGESLVAATHAGGVGVIVALVAGVVAYNAVGDIEQASGREIPSLPASRQRSPQKNGQPGKIYRLLNGKSARGDSPAETNTETNNEEDDDDFEFEASGTFILSMLLADGWRPSADKIFLARLDDGTDVFVNIKQIVHIALAGSTRMGKSSIMRQLLAQFCYIGYHCILLDPHYTPFDLESNEDWSPFTRHLRSDPLKCKSYDRIEEILKYTATTFLDKRRQLRASVKPVGRHTFIFIDEYPAIIAEKPKVQGYVAKLLREGGKYNIHLVVASQDFQVKTVSPQAGGAIREHYNVCLYVGGDSTTAKVLLNKAIDGSEESILGKGSIYLRCPTCQEAAHGHTPWSDNDAIYELVGETMLSDQDIDQMQNEADTTDETASLNPSGQEETNEKSAENQPTEKASIAPNIEQRLKSEDLHIDTLTQAWNAGINKVDKIEAFFKMSHREAHKAYKRVKAQRGEPVDEQE